MDRGLMHLYFGNGKGKTTAAAGLAARALGSGKKVVFLQFMKTGTSSELEPLRKLGAVVFSGMGGIEKFSSQMSFEEKKSVRIFHDENLKSAVNLIKKEGADLLILDEACSAASKNLLDEAYLQAVVLERPLNLEIVLTGRDPSRWMVSAADYVTEMKAIKHPFEQGITARKGIEY